MKVRGEKIRIWVTACIDTGHKLAEEHIKRQGADGPDAAAWQVFGSSWVARGAKRWDPTVGEDGAWVASDWSSVEHRCISEYAAAALGYSTEMERRYQYEVPAESRALWAGGNTFGMRLV
jgi:hypothetical protein